MNFCVVIFSVVVILFLSYFGCACDSPHFLFY